MDLRHVVLVEDVVIAYGWIAATGVSYASICIGSNIFNCSTIYV